MGDLIEHNGNNGAESAVVRVGDAGSPVSMKAYQDIYHQVTGRTEQIRKRYSDNLLVEFSELQQLHFKISQLCEVHEIIASNEVVSIFHERERKEQFSSFDRFKAYNANATSPSVSIVLKYNFSIILSGMRRPQEYVITIRLVSRVAMLRQIEEESPGLVALRMLTYSGRNTAEITIDYADYVVARGFLEAFDEWIVGCKKNPRKKWLQILSRWSHIVPDIAKIGAALSVMFFAMKAIPEVFIGTFTAETWARFLVVYGGGAFVLISLMAMVGGLIELAIDSYPIMSYLKLNKGDENLIGEFKQRRNGVVWKFLAGCVIAIILGVVASKLEKLI